jgi:gas vesicle structural protein
MMQEELEQFEESELSLLETLDHVLNSGIVIAGEITISVADVDLLFIGLNLLLTSVETARDVLGQREKLATRESLTG